MATHRSLFSAAKILVLAVACALANASPAMEVKVFAISDFVPEGSGGCGGDDVSHWNNMVDEWYDEMEDHGHTKDGQYTNGNMTIRRFCDPDWDADCLDGDYLDDADAAMIATHGSDSDDHWRGLMRASWNGHCRLDAGEATSEMYVGDLDLEFIHLSSCHSADDDNLGEIRHALTDPVDGGYAHSWTGFHGNMWIGGTFDDDYEDFADDAHSVSIAEAWATNHYHSNSVGCRGYDPFNWFGTCDDQCPVAVVFSTSSGNASTRLNNERYNNVYSHPTGNSAGVWMGYLGCNPVGEDGFAP